MLASAITTRLDTPGCLEKAIHAQPSCPVARHPVLSVPPSTLKPCTQEATIASSRLSRTVDTQRTYLIATIVAAVGIVFLWWGGSDGWPHVVSLHVLAANLGGLLIASVAIGIIWDLAGKRAFAREILAASAAATDVEAMGITRMSMNYVEVPNWADLFAGATKLDVFVAYGRTWRNNNLARLREMALRPGTQIRIFHPDPTDLVHVQVMASRFEIEPADLAARIEESRREFLGLQVGAGSSVEVYYRPGDSLFSCYRFDGTAVVTLYTHTMKRGAVPTFVCRDRGLLYNFIRDDLDAIAKQSSLAGPPEGTNK